MADVVLNNLQKDYAGRRAVAGLELHVQDGELLVLVGPSGCGKTTTLRLIAGLEDPTAGQIRIAGREVTQLAPKDRHVAMVFQHFTLYPHRNVFQNLAFGLQLQGVPRQHIEPRVRQVAGMLGVEHLLQRRPHELSGGERQRIALGRAVVRQPQVLLLDEPLSNLDARWRESLQNDLLELQQRLGTTTIHVTHDQQEALRLGQRIAVMQGGRIQQLGSPHEVYHAPANRVVAEFLGSPPMNFLTGRLQWQGEAASIVSPPLCLPLPRDRWPTLRAAPAEPITLGIRPEDLRLVRPAEGCWAPLLVEVVRCQMRGADSILQLRSGPLAWNALLAPGADAAGLAPRAGQRLQVYLDLSKCHLFTADGARLGVNLSR